VPVVRFYNSTNQNALPYSRIGNSSDAPTVLDASWIIPDPNQSLGPYLDPSPPDLSVTGFIPGQELAVSRNYTVKVHYGTLAGCRVVIIFRKRVNLGSGLLWEEEPVMDKTFAASDGKDAVFTLNYIIEADSNARNRFQMQLYDANGGLTSAFFGPGIGG
jgi:hypothetical protein